MSFALIVENGSQRVDEPFLHPERWIGHQGGVMWTDQAELCVAMISLIWKPWLGSESIPCAVSTISACVDGTLFCISLGRPGRVQCYVGLDFFAAKNILTLDKEANIVKLNAF